MIKIYEEGECLHPNPDVDGVGLVPLLLIVSVDGSSELNSVNIDGINRIVFICFFGS